MSVDKFKFISPGIFVNEIDNTGRAATPEDVGHALIGRSEKGPILQPIRVNSYFEFVKVFGQPIPGGKGGDVFRDGNYTSPTYAAYAAQAWFRNNSPITFIRIGGRARSNGTGDGLAGWKTTDVEPGNTTLTNGGAFGLFVANAPTRSDYLSASITVDKDTVPSGQTIVFDDFAGTTRTITSGTITNSTTFDASSGAKNTIAGEIKDAINAGTSEFFVATVAANIVTLEVNAAVSPLNDVPILYQGPSIKESGGAATAATAEIAGVMPGALVGGESFTLTNAA